MLRSLAKIVSIFLFITLSSSIGNQLNAQDGKALFSQNCASCHTEPLFASNDFKNNGLPIDDSLNDFGRMKITGNGQQSLMQGKKHPF